MAHGVDASHEIFRSPLAVNPTFVDIDTPKNYSHWPDGVGLPPKLRAWKVHEKTFPEIDPGVVSNPYGFLDTPDAELISSGVNSKGPGSVALARQGNFFLWGFYGAPSVMTEEGRRCFINAICYISKFDGQPPLLRRRGWARDWALVYPGYLDQGLNDEAFIKGMFPPELYARFGKDAALYRAYYRENLEYLVAAQQGYATDEDARALGISNRSIAILDACVDRLARNEDVDRARRVLERYTDERFGADAGKWQQWLDDHRQALFFSDTSGFKFFVDPVKQAAARSAGSR